LTFELIKAIALFKQEQENWLKSH